MNQTDETRRFWRLLADYEELTRGETAAIQQRDYPSLEGAGRLKGSILPVLVQSGAELGLNRDNCPELRARLETVAANEAGNLRTLAERRELIQKRVDEMNAAWQRLRGVKRNYRAVISADAPIGSFAACG